jgi:hypothetical protein
VYALLAVDTDSHLDGVEDDARSMSAALGAGFGNSRILEMKVLEGNDVRPEVIAGYFRTLRCGQDDVLLFYYSGHGAMVEGRGHMLTTSHGNLARSDLRAVMGAKQPRLSVLLTDCCSSLFKPRKLPPAPGAPAPRPEISPLLRCLLLEHRGVVDITSSSYGEASWGRPGFGGFFTNALGRAMGAWDIDPFDDDTLTHSTTTKMAS